MPVTNSVSPPIVTPSELATLLEELNRATAELAGHAEVPEGVAALIKSLPERLRADAAPWQALPDRYMASQAYAGTSRAVAALFVADAAEQRRSARLGLEQVRQAVRDLVETRWTDEDLDVRDLTAWLETVLEGSSSQLARLIGTSPTTWKRWARGFQQPDDVSELRLRRVARVVGQLQYTLAPAAVLRWFDRPHPELKDGAGTPAELLDDADGFVQIYGLAAGLRSMQAS